MNIDCHTCHARYHVDLALFKGAKGMRVRCRRCGNSLYVLNPGAIASDRNVVNDTSYSRDPSDNSGIEPAVSLPGQEQSTPPEREWTVSVREPAPLSQENGEKEKSWDEIWNTVSADVHALVMNYPPLLKPQGKARSRSKFRWSSLLFRS